MQRNGAERENQAVLQHGKSHSRPWLGDALNNDITCWLCSFKADSVVVNDTRWEFETCSVTFRSRAVLVGSKHQ